MRNQKPTLKIGCIAFLAAIMIALVPAGLQASGDAEGVVIRKRKAADTVRVLTANIRFPLDRDNGSGDEWSIRKDLCTEVMAAQAADIICIQEGRMAHMPALKKAFPDFEYFDLGQPSATGEGPIEPSNAIFWNTKRFEKKDEGGYWLSETPEIPRSKFKESASVRYTTWVLLKDKQAGRGLLVFNTHFDHKYEAGRLLQAKALVEFAAKTPPHNVPRILTGDFNTNISKDSIPYIKQHGWTDSYESLHGSEDPGATFHNFLGPKEPKSATRGKIDFIFHNDRLKAIDTEIIKDSRKGRYPSDHYFVSAELEYLK